MNLNSRSGHTGKAAAVRTGRLRLARAAAIAFAFVLAALGCSSKSDPPVVDTDIHEGTCESPPADPAPDSLKRIGCRTDFDGLASQPLDATLPGARSMKVVLDQADHDTLYFQNSNKYKIHFEFASAHLSGMGRPVVTGIADFNRIEYYAPDRRFVLAAVTYYEGPKAWVLEIAPYDTMSSAMITKLYEAIKASAYFGPALAFHPTSQTIEAGVKNLPPSIRITTTEELYAKIDYQPLNLGEAIGRVRFVKASALATQYVGFRDIVVLDHVPNDISVVAGLITEDFQTPLSHVNVLAQNRKTPNMGLRHATTNAKLRALDGQWAKFTVGAFDWDAVPASQAEADAFWEAHKPAPVTLPDMDLTVTELRDMDAVTPLADVTHPTKPEITAATKIFGAKAANYSIIVRIPEVPHRKAFAIPVYYYEQHMRENGFFARVDTMIADPAFVADPSVRDKQLTQLMEDIVDAPVNAEFQALLKAKLDTEYPGETIRFRSSTNAEDLDGFPCAGCYDSHTGDPKDWEGDLIKAVKQTWSTVWKFRTFEERAYHSIDHKTVGMALLVHHNFPNEAANGVSVTANPFDPSGLEPGFYVNVQWGGDAEVVAPPPGVTSDEFIYQFTFPGQPIIYLSHSNLVPKDSTVLTPRQVFELGSALDAIHNRFASAFRPAGGGWYAMDVEFKYEGDVGEVPGLVIKQGRPYPGRGQ